MRNFENTKKIVIKIGTNVLTKEGTIEIDEAYIRRIAKQVSELLDSKHQVLIISSGAIGMGAGQLGVHNKVKDTKMAQACAAIGQPLLMQTYRKAFLKYKVNIAQVLLTTDVLINR